MQPPANPTPQAPPTPVLPYSPQRALDVFESSGVRIDAACHRWRLHVLDQMGGQRGEYVILWPLEWREIVDRARSDVTYYRGTKVPSEIHRWVLPSPPPDYDLFSTAHFRWLATPAVKDVTSRAGLTGFGFDPIACELAPAQ